MTQPTVGRIVHWKHPDGSGPLAAIITSVVSEDAEVTLTVFEPSKMPGYVVRPVPFADTLTPGHWSWPPRS